MNTSFRRAKGDYTLKSMDLAQEADLGEKSDVVSAPLLISYEDDARGQWVRATFISAQPARTLENDEVCR
jgi:hypothetical protein